MKVYNIIIGNIIELILLSCFIVGAINDYIIHDHFPFGYINAILWLLLATVRKLEIERLDNKLKEPKK